MIKITSLFCLLFLYTTGVAQKFEGLALTPPMGWNSWNTFGINISADLVKGVADELVRGGYRDAGYTYLVLDDGWMLRDRDSIGNLVADPAKFPQGMKVVVDYVHSKGLKVGIYNCAGATTCGGFAGSRGHEYQDARLYASWGIDYLKYDWCNTPKLNAEAAYTTMRDALFAAKRPVVFSICEWGDNQPWTWAAPIGHLWRTTGDIAPCWDCEENHGSWSSWGLLRIVDMRKGIRAVAGPGHWNDPDMMEVGNGMMVNEDRAHFSLWAMLAAPLIMGNDIRSASAATREILTNREVIAIGQDALGIQANAAWREGALDVWIKPLQNGDWALCFLNRGDAAYTLKYDWKHHNIADDLAKKSEDFNKATFQIRDVWKKQPLGTTKDVLNAVIPSHDVLMLRLTKQ